LLLLQEASGNDDANSLIESMRAKLKKATLEDLDEIHAIESRTFKKDAFSRREFHRLLTEPNAIVFELVANGRILALVAGETRQSSMHTVGVIQTIEVLPAFRRQGLGTKLIASILREFARRGVTSAVLQLRPNNHNAKRLYKKMGFTFRRSIADFYGPKEDALEFERPIP